MIQYKLEKANSIKEAMNNLYTIVSYLRDPVEGCPWDNKQTPKDMIRDLQGEVYEYIDALYDNNNDHKKEELGDIFLSLFLLAKIHDQDGDFKLLDCLNETCEKYIRRHPHVFSKSSEKISDAKEVLKQWNDIKINIEGRKDFDNYFYEFKNMPEFERCYEISNEAARVGFEWKNLKDIVDKVREELIEVENADKDNLEDELGDVLFSAVNLCRFLHIKPQDALQHANRKFMNRFEYINNKIKKLKLNFKDLSDKQWNDLWIEAKKNYKN